MHLQKEHESVCQEQRRELLRGGSGTAPSLPLGSQPYFPSSQECAYTLRPHTFMYMGLAGEAVQPLGTEFKQCSFANLEWARGGWGGPFPSLHKSTISLTAAMLHRHFYLSPLTQLTRINLELALSHRDQLPECVALTT